MAKYNGGPEGKKNYGRAKGTRPSKANKPKDIAKPLDYSGGTLGNFSIGTSNANGFTFTLDGIDYSGDSAKWSTQNSSPLDDLRAMMRDLDAINGAVFKEVDLGYTFRTRRGLDPGKPIESNSRINWKPIDFKVRDVRVVRDSSYYASIYVDFSVPDRETGLPLSLTYHQPCLASLVDETLAEEVTRAIANAFDHELKEMIYVGSKRLREPHPEDKGRIHIPL